MGALRPWARYGLLAVAHLLALGFGATVLQALEGPPALRLQANLRAELTTFQAEFGACLPPGALEELLGTALVAQAHGVSSLGNDSEARKWDLPSALLFTASLLTTTGKAARRPGRKALSRPSLPGAPEGAALSRPQTARQNPGLIRPVIRAGAPPANTPQLVPQLQVPGGVASSAPPPGSCETRGRCPDPTGLRQRLESLCCGMDSWMEGNGENPGTTNPGVWGEDVS